MKNRKKIFLPPYYINHGTLRCDIPQKRYNEMRDLNDKLKRFIAC